MALNHNFSTQISDLDALRRIAAKAGFVQKRGAQKGRGSIRQLLEALIEGKATVKIAANEASLTDQERSDLELQQKMVEQGLLSTIQLRTKRKLSPFQPFPVDGEPLSSMILRERR